MSIVIIGASHAGVTLAFSLRQEGFKEHITLISKEDILPYHRPPLSKTFLSEEKPIDSYVLKGPNAYENADIELKLGTEIISIETQQKQVHTNSNEAISYTKLVLATGGRAFIPPIKGAKHENVLSLRTAKDVLQIKEKLTSGSKLPIGIIGGGYIGLELAATLSKLNRKVLLFERENRILSRSTSPEVSRFFNDIHTARGLKFKYGHSVKAFLHEKDKMLIQTDNQELYESQFAIIGAGLRINDELAVNSGLDTEDGIKVNEYLQTSHHDIYAIGDCCKFYSTIYHKWLRLESVQNANDQARVLAKTLTGKPTLYENTPWFWSDQYDLKLQTVGLSQGFDSLITRIEEGDPQKRSYWYFKKGQLLAVDAINNGKAYAIASKCLQQKININQDILADPKQALNLNTLTLRETKNGDDKNKPQTHLLN